MSRALPCTQPTANLLTLPQELINLIVDAVDSDEDNNAASLAQLLSISSVFHHPVRKLLFWETDLEYDDDKHQVDASGSSLINFLGLIDNSGSEVLSHVRMVNLRLHGNIQNYYDDERPPISNLQVLSLIQKLIAAPNLETLCLGGTGWNCKGWNNAWHDSSLSPYDCDIAKALLTLRCKPQLRTLGVEWDCLHSSLVMGIPGEDSVQTLCLASESYSDCRQGEVSWTRIPGGVLIVQKQLTPPARVCAQGLSSPSKQCGALDPGMCSPLRNLTTLQFSDAQPWRFPWISFTQHHAFCDGPKDVHTHGRHLWIMTSKEPMFPSLETLFVDCELHEEGYLGLTILMKHAPKLRELRFQESFHPRKSDSPQVGEQSFPYDAVTEFFPVARTHPSLEDITIDITIREHIEKLYPGPYCAFLSGLAEFLTKFTPRQSKKVTTLRLSIHCPLTHVTGEGEDECIVGSLNMQHENCILRPSENWDNLQRAIKHLAGLSLKSFFLDFVFEEEYLCLCHTDYRGSEAHKQVERRCAELGEGFRALGLEGKSQFILLEDD